MPTNPLSIRVEPAVAPGYLWIADGKNRIVYCGPLVGSPMGLPKYRGCTNYMNMRDVDDLRRELAGKVEIVVRRESGSKH